MCVCAHQFCQLPSMPEFSSFLNIGTIYTLLIQDRIILFVSSSDGQKSAPSPRKHVCLFYWKKFVCHLPWSHPESPPPHVFIKSVIHKAITQAIAFSELDIPHSHLPSSGTEAVITQRRCLFNVLKIVGLPKWSDKQ